MPRNLNDLELFLGAAETGSLSGAARRLGLTPAAASASLKRLEIELKAPLFIRSTRSLRLTPEGQVFREHCEQALALLAAGQVAVTEGGSRLRGQLHLSLPSDLGRNVVLPWLDEFQSLHPELSVRLQFTDRLTDIYREPVDLALRYGRLSDSSLVALPVAPDNRRVLCAAPAYLERAGTPESPQALSQHNCLCFQLDEYVHDRWNFQRDGFNHQVEVNGDRVADDGDAVRRWALAGQGIAYKSALDVATDLRAGRLVALCPEWQGEAAPLSLVCSDRRRLNPMVRAWRDFLESRCDDALSTVLPAPALP